MIKLSVRLALVYEQSGHDLIQVPCGISALTVCVISFAYSTQEME